jgi:hypothetical protein
MPVEADSLERQAWQMLQGFGAHQPEVRQMLARALRIRERSQGKDHADIIWTLSLLIDALRYDGSLTSARKAAKLGERRLLLRRKVLATAPEEIACSIAELVELYHFETEPFDKKRIRELRRRAN